MKNNKAFTAMLVGGAFVAGLMMNNGQQQEAQASVDLSALYTQLDAMQNKLDNLSITCQRECDASNEYSLPQFKVTEFVTVTEVMTDTVVLTEYLTEVVYRDRVITETETAYVDVPACNQPTIDEPAAPVYNEPEVPQDEQPEAPQDEPEADAPQVEDEPEAPQVEDVPKPKCNQGVGNGDEGCDPGNSNHNQDSNDEATSDGKVPGSPGRQHNANGNSDDKPKGKSDKVKAGKADKGKSKNS